MSNVTTGPDYDDGREDRLTAAYNALWDARVRVTMDAGSAFVGRIVGEGNVPGSFADWLVIDGPDADSLTCVLWEAISEIVPAASEVTVAVTIVTADGSVLQGYGPRLQLTSDGWCVVVSLASPVPDEASVRVIDVVSMTTD
jgi:hypothetical protein